MRRLGLAVLYVLSSPSMALKASCWPMGAARPHSPTKGHKGMGKHILLAGAAILALSTAAKADTVDFSNITAYWYSANPASSIDFTVNNGPNQTNPQAYWGGAGVNGDSGYTFQSASGTVSAIVPPSPSPDFTLGTFQHINKPITGASITGINLAVNADISINGTDEGNKVFLFHFTHDETPNGDSPCADGGHVGSGVDVNGCADHVTVNALASTSTFDIGGDHYTISIQGFEQGGNFATSFWTEEGVTNTAFLEANVELYTDAINPNGPGGAPEASTWAMGAIGFGFLGLIGRRKTRKGERSIA
jgi:hypothetical protein